jgi:hypothetical protein
VKRGCPGCSAALPEPDRPASGPGPAPEQPQSGRPFGHRWQRLADRISTAGHGGLSEKTGACFRQEKGLKTVKCAPIGQKKEMIMKKLVLTMMILFLTAGVAFAKDFEITKKAGDYTVQVIMDRNPPVVGANKMEIGIKAKAADVTDAAVQVDYGMAAMPGMPAMNYKTKADLTDKKYRATLKLSMSGPWFINVKITRAGKTQTVKLNVDVQ